MTGADNPQGSLLAISRYNPSETTRRASLINKELAILLGLLFTDGCVSPKGNSWRLYFSAKSENLVETFGECIIQLFSLDERRVLRRRTQHGYLCAIVNSKEIGDLLVGNFGTFRTLASADGKMSNARLPLQLLQKSGKEITQWFLRAAFSGDGGLCFYPAYRSGPQGGTRWLIRTVFLSCAHPKLRQDYMQLLKFLGISAREVSGDGKIKMETKQSISDFHRQIGFLPKTKITNASRWWRGLDKQEILELMISSYENPSAVYNIPKFKRR